MLGLMDYKIQAMQPSLVAAAAVSLVLDKFGLQWTESIIFWSSFKIY